MGRVTERRRVLRIRDGRVDARADTLVAEEPLEIRLSGRPLAITMRTPGVPLPDITLERNVYTTSSCGLCGKASLDAVRTTARWPVADTPRVRITPALLATLPDQLRAAQRVFDRTGGLHAAALFSPEGELLDVREDVGRHNAVDKLVGRALRSGQLPLSRCGLLVSGRASFELAQKAVMAGIPILAAVSAPSSLAVDLAAETGLTLVGFLRGDSMNVYAGEERIDTTAEATA
ncbi:formate dehydrogenase accessory sulfurtransferase FdhD [Streptomyces sp. NPDC057616]|uniref:formate dehydrogenase accessory sulfurtransferase FdhD n=1 Tax=Streptomyces sp. NPDC057616 TaxID=3346183 RepID=UPI0036864639